MTNPPASKIERPILICNLERISVRASGGEGGIDLGFNLATGLEVVPAENGDAGALDLLRFLQPWKWPLEGELPAVDFVLFHQVPGAAKLARVARFAARFDVDEEASERLQPRLQAAMETLGKQLPGWLDGAEDHPEVQWRREVVAVEKVAEADLLHGRWPARLGELAQLPFPLPQLLGLCGRFHVPAAAVPGAGDLFVVPILPMALGLEALEIEPADPAGPAMPQRFDYVQTVEVEGDTEESAEPTIRKIVRASTYCNALSPTRPPLRLWIENLDFYVEDWRSHLEQRLVEGLFLAPAFVEWQAERWQKAEEANKAGEPVAVLKQPLEAKRIDEILRRLLVTYLGEERAALLKPPNWQEPAGHSAEQFARWRRSIDNVAKELVESGVPSPAGGPGGVLTALHNRLAREGAEARDAVKDAIDNVFDKVFPGHFDDDTVKGWFIKRRDDLAEHVVPKANATPKIGKAGQTEGITLRLAPLRADPEPPPGPEPQTAENPGQQPIGDVGDDDARASRGVVVLARTVGDADWSCLNWGRPLFAGKGGEVDGIPLLLPARLSYSNGLSQSTVTYDNAPISVPGPLEKLGAWRLDCTSDACGAGRDALLRFDCTPTRTIPRLIFGRKYEFAAFRVANSGTLPEEMQSESSPWRLDEGLTEVRHAKVAPAYQRRVPVGAIRVKPVLANLPLGAPAGVTPRLERQQAENGKPPEDGRPLLFLHYDLGSRQSRTEASFELRRPDLDWRTWERWPDVGHLRAQVLSEYLCGVYQGREDLELDDPAVTGFEVSVESLDPGGRSESSPLQLAEADAEMGENGLPGEVRLPASKLHVVLADDVEPFALVPAGSGLTVRVKPGGIYRIVVTCQVAAVSDRFAPGFRAPTWELDVEAAEPFLEDLEEKEVDKAAAALWDAVATRFDESTGVLHCNLDVESLQLHDQIHRRLRRQVLKAEVLRQSWAWRGRPLAPCHPDLPAEPGESCAPKSSDELERYLDWEVAEMGFRSDDNHAVYPMQRGPGALRFGFSDSLGVGRGRDGDRRAGHHRFAVRVISRYRALFGRHRASLVSRKIGILWHRRFVPCRWSDEVPPPRVRAVLPLTEDRSPDGRGPGFLVVLDEGWHEVGGLDERLEVDLMRTNVPVEATTIADEPECLTHLQATPPESAPALPVMGPDPIVFAHGYVEDDEKAIRFKVEPAVGHSHEIEAPLPRIRACSFIVRPYIADGFKTHDLSWWFFQVRFRRVISVGGEPKESVMTQPYWVQLLPSFCLLRKEPAEMTARYTGNNRVQIHHGDEIGRQLPVGESGRLLHYLLLTRRVTDALGQNQEIYLGLLHWRENSFEAEPELCRVLAEGVAGLQVRRLEVQQRKGESIGSSRELWKQLFGTDDRDNPEDAQARIIRMSDPMPLKDARKPQQIQEVCP